MGFPLGLCFRVWVVLRLIADSQLKEWHFSDEPIPIPWVLFRPNRNKELYILFIYLAFTDNVKKTRV